MKVYWDSACLLHNPPHEILSGRMVPYYESPNRITEIKASLEQNESFEIIPISVENGWPQVKDHVLAVHSADYVDYLESIYREWVAIGGDKSAVFPETFRNRQLQYNGPQDVRSMSPLAQPGHYSFDLSCPITADTYHAAIASVEVALSAARALSSGDGVSLPQGIFALCRPPGHHAQDALCGGYCYLNNAAIAAKYLSQQCGSHRVAILDVDYHHGNGTQQIFYTDPLVVYASLHAQGDYPYFTGSAQERGSGQGEGYNHNFPLPTGTTDDAYCETLQNATNVIRSYSDVDYLIVSLGLDTYEEDPICEFLLTRECYARIGKIIASLSKPTLFVMEGGYHIDTLGENVRNVLLGFERLQ